jgi:hypothetical protein
MKDGVNDIETHESSLPSLYPAGSDKKAHTHPSKIVFESVVHDDNTKYLRESVPLKEMTGVKFTLDLR